MKKISKKEVRSKQVANVLASLRIENLEPGEYVVKGLHACMNGQETTANLMKQVISHHVKVRGTEHASLILLDEAKTGLKQLLAGQRVSNVELLSALADQ